MILVPNKDQKSKDYSEMSVAYRPSHADATYDMKYGIRAVAGGGRSSARETIGRVAAGAVAKKLLKMVGNTEVSYFLLTLWNQIQICWACTIHTRKSLNKQGIMACAIFVLSREFFLCSTEYWSFHFVPFIAPWFHCPELRLIGVHPHICTYMIFADAESHQCH